MSSFVDSCRLDVVGTRRFSSWLWRIWSAYADLGLLDVMYLVGSLYLCSRSTGLTYI
jgi:hypothetical protein